MHDGLGQRVLELATDMGDVGGGMRRNGPQVPVVLWSVGNHIRHGAAVESQSQTATLRYTVHQQALAI